MTFHVLRNKKSLLLLILVICIPFSALADDWTIAAQTFDFTQNNRHSSADESVASLIPELILEQLSESSVRNTSEEEMLDRKLEDLQTERLSLFLQLKKEVKARDAIVLTATNYYDLKHGISEEEEKIEEIKKSIDDTLAEGRKAKFETLEKLEKRMGRKKESFFDYLKKFFYPGTSLVNNIASENIVLYSSDSGLFTPSEAVLEAGYESYEYEAAVRKEKINGLVTGSITVLDDYIAVTADLRIFPGNRIIASVTEVGTLSDCLELSHNIAYELIPKITNALPVRINFKTDPVVKDEDTVLLIDGVIYPSLSDKITVNSGIHTIEVNSKGYDLVTLLYDFENAPEFNIYIPLSETKTADISLKLIAPLIGSFYANGEFTGTVDEEVRNVGITVNGKPVIGQFFVEDGDDELSAYYYIPANLQSDGNSLYVKLNPIDLTSEIDKRRIWMYRGYSALMLTLPFTFYAIGEQTVKYNYWERLYDEKGKSAAATLAAARDNNKWCYIKWVSEGVSVTAGAFFVYELVRYLTTASKVLPTSAKKIKSPKKVKETAAETVQDEEETTEVIETDSEYIDEIAEQNKDGI